MQEKNENTEDFKSWLVAAGCSFIHCLLTSPFRLAGLIFVELIEKYNIDRSQASIPMFMFTCVLSIIGPFTGFIGKKIGPYNIVICGCIIASVGIGVNFFAEDILTVTIFLGIVYGTGYSGGSLMLPSILQIHFKRNYNSASGIFNAGASLAAFIFPPIAVLLFQKYGISGSLLILSAILINSVPAAILIKKAGIKNENFSVSQTSSDEIKKKIKSAQKEISCEQTDQQKAPLSLSKEHKNLFSRNQSLSLKKKQMRFNQDSLSKKTMLDNSDKDYIKTNEFYRQRVSSVFTVPVTNSITENQLPQETKDLQKQATNGNDDCIMSSFCFDNKDLTNSKLQIDFTDMSLKNLKEKGKKRYFPINLCQNNSSSFSISTSVFLDPSFLIIMLLTSILLYLITAVRTTLIDYSRDKAIDREYEPYILMFQSVFDFIGRVALVWVVDKNYLTSSTFTIMGFSVQAMSIGIIVISNEVIALIVGTSLFEISTGAVMAVLIGMLVEFLEKDKLTMAIPCRYILYAPMSFTSFPLIGYFRKELNSYDGLYYVLVALSLLCSAITPLAGRFSKKNKEKKVIILTLS